MTDTTITDTDVLVIIDPQNDFCEGGALAVAGADAALMEAINEIAKKFKHVVLSQDWHPQDQISFASNHAGAEPFTVIDTEYGPQTLWPDHCVQGTFGAEFHAALNTDVAAVIIRKGHNSKVDSYSAFKENDKKTSTGLAGYLFQMATGQRVFFVGLAYDFCVGYSALDAIQPGKMASFESIVIKDLCRAIAMPVEHSTNPAFTTVDQIEEAFAEKGVKVINTGDIA